MQRHERPRNPLRSVVFGGENQGAAQRYFRAEIPSRSLSLFGWKASVANLVLAPKGLAEISIDPRLRAIDVPPVGESWPEIGEPPDIITLRLMDDVDVTDLENWRRSVIDMPGSITRARKAGQVVLYDLDDDIWNIPDWSPAKNAKHAITAKSRAYDLEVIEANIASCDGVLVSTPQVERSLKEHVPSANVWVMRSGIDPTDWGAVKEPRERLRIGWMCPSMAYEVHIEHIIPALALLNDVDAEFCHLGWIPEKDEECRKMWEKLGVSRVHAVPWQPFGDIYPELAQCDLALIPRAYSPFAEGHSHSSGLEWASSGVPFVATWTEEYARLSSLGAGVVCTNTDSWEFVLKELLYNVDRRRSLAVDGLAAVKEHHSLEPTGAELDTLFSDLLENR